MLRVIKKIGRLFGKKQKRKLFVLTILMIIGSFLEVLGVGLMVPFMTALMDENTFFSNETVISICRICNIDNIQKFILLCVGLLIFIFIFKDLFLIFEEKLQLKFVYNNRFKTQCKVLEAYLKKPYEYYLSTNSGEVARAVCDDVNYAYLILTTFLTMLTNLTMGIALLITVFIISPIITVAVLLSIIIAVGAIVFFVKPVLEREGKNRMEASAKASMWLYQSVQGIKEIKVTQSNEFFQKSYSKHGLALIKADQKNTVWGTISKRIIEMTTVSAVLLIIVIMILQGNDLKNIIPALSAFAMAAVRLLPSATAIVNSANAIAYQEQALDKLLENLENMKKDNVVNDKSEYNNAKLTFKNNIELRNIVYSYPEYDKKILNGANMRIPIGSSVGIVGESGAGKTTAVDILLGLLLPEKGEVLTDGVNIQENYHEWLTHVGYISQTIFLVDDTIRTNVTFGKDFGKKTDEYVIDALKKAQLYEYVSSLPDGINTKIGERGIKLSGGQRQRVGIARALLGDPDILVFDEATSALDNGTEEAIMDSINKLHGQKTMIIIAHRLSTLKECDIIYEVSNGKIIETNRKELGV